MAYILQNLVFVPIEYKDFIPGKKYLILEHDTFCTKKIRATYKEYHVDYYKRWEKRIHISEELTSFRGSSMTHYTLVSNCQQQMENRAINMILRKVIGDDTFSY